MIETMYMCTNNNDEYNVCSGIIFTRIYTGQVNKSVKISAITTNLWVQTYRVPQQQSSGTTINMDFHKQTIISVMMHVVTTNDISGNLPDSI